MKDCDFNKKKEKENYYNNYKFKARKQKQDITVRLSTLYNEYFITNIFGPSLSGIIEKKAMDLFFTLH